MVRVRVEIPRWEIEELCYETYEYGAKVIKCQEFSDYIDVSPKDVEMDTQDLEDLVMEYEDEILDIIAKDERLMKELMERTKKYSRRYTNTV